MHYDMEDLLEQANEIQESLGRSYAVPDELDEADLEAGTQLRVIRQFSMSIHSVRSELDALELETEEEGTSYLADINKVPDFIDEPPMELGEVSIRRSFSVTI
jgi:charged multivesicular body protein 5